MNKKIFSYTFFTAALLVLCLSFSMKADAAVKMVIIDGVEYYLDLEGGTAEASIEDAAIPESPDGSIISEVTVHNQITYDDKTYTVRNFDIGHDVNSEVEGMIIRDPSRLWYHQKYLKKLTFPKNICKIWGYYGGSSLSGLKKIYIKAPKLKKADLTGIPTKCTVYVKNNTVRNQVRKSGFKGNIVAQK